MRLHQRIVGNLAPHSDQRIPELLASELPARLSQFVRRTDPVGTITARQFPRDDRDQDRIVRVGKTLAVAQGLQAARRPARPDDQPAYAEHRSARFLTGSSNQLLGAGQERCRPPSKSWQVNCGWVIAANIAADLAAWTRLLGFCDDPDLREADPDTLRYRVWHIPARLARHARERILKISPDWPWKDAFLTCWQRLCALPAPA